MEGPNLSPGLDKSWPAHVEFQSFSFSGAACYWQVRYFILFYLSRFTSNALLLLELSSLFKSARHSRTTQCSAMQCNTVALSRLVLCLGGNIFRVNAEDLKAVGRKFGSVSVVLVRCLDLNVDRVVSFW